MERQDTDEQDGRHKMRLTPRRVRAGLALASVVTLAVIADAAASPSASDETAPSTTVLPVAVGTSPATDGSWIEALEDPAFAARAADLFDADPPPTVASDGTEAGAGSSTSADPVSTAPPVPDEPTSSTVPDPGPTATPIPLTSAPAEPEAQPLSVVPGLAGFGTSTPAGRGGAVLVVSSLADDGPGSLREALSTAGPRTIVFEVGGTIWLEGPLIVTEPFFTLAGQTAPDPGITIAGYQMSIRTHDVLIQHVRVRAGDLHGGDPEGISLYQPGGRSVHDIVIDHTSTSWAIDENTNTWSATAGDPGPDAGVHDVTFSYNLIVEALDDSTHPFGPHSKGMLVGDGSERVSVIRNVFANNADRNPEMTGGTSAVVVNNVIYGWDPKHEATHFGRAGTIPDEPTCAAVVSNVYLRSAEMGDVEAAAIEIHRDLPPASKLYVSGNLSPRITGIRNDSVQDPFVETAPLWPQGLEVVPATFITEPLLAMAGARPADRDEVDRRVVADVAAGTGSVIDTQDEVGGWPVSEPTTRVLELPAEPSADDDADGYTNLEEFLHEEARRVEGRSASVSPAFVPSASLLRFAPEVSPQPCD